jgi:DNA polymerase I-like protein with 3'-5' exonuclease and polymerase domains
VSDGGMEELFGQLDELERPKVEKREWMNSVSMELITSRQALKRVIAECINAGLYALDLETTGLDARVFPGPDVGRTVDKIVGYCLSPDGEKGYYVPVRHKDSKGDFLECNINPRKAAVEMRKLADSDAVAIFHNAKFDHEFLQFGEEDGPIGEWDKPESYEDTLILAYLRNTRERRKGLKYLSREELGLEMIELSDLYTDEDKKKMKGGLDFSLLDPEWEPCVWYACSDAICTYRLCSLFLPVILSPEPHGQSQATIYKLEKMCLPATRWMERCRILIDRAKIGELIELGQAEWLDSLEEVYDAASTSLGRNIRPAWYRLMRGTEDVAARSEYVFDPSKMKPTYMEVRKEAQVRGKQLGLDPVEATPGGKERVRTLRKEVPGLTGGKKKENVDFPVVYDVTIAAELGLLLRDLGVEGLQTTEKSGQIKTSKDVLDRVIEDAEEQFPFMAKIKRFRETAKALGTNLFPIWHDTSKDRSPDGSIWVGFNGHKVDTGRFATPKPRDKGWHGQVRWNLHSIPATYDKKKPACMLRIREAICARENHLLFAIDFAGVELRCVTNLSHEPLWLTEFFRCSGCNHTFDRGHPGKTAPTPPPFCPKCGSDKIGDLHSLTCQAIYGEVSKAKRQKAKGLNFAMCYGGGGMAAQRSVGVDRDEGWRIKRQFDTTYTGLRQWWEIQHNFARQYEYVVTAFGRRYPVPDIKHEMGGFRSKAERNSVNGPVQGFSADITKLAMALVFKECKKRKWLKLVRMTITIHDELVFEIHDSIAEEAVTVIKTLMTTDTVSRLKHPVPLTVDVEFGQNWTVPFDLTKLAFNHGGGEWDAHLIGVFPESYAYYLSCGGKPLEGVDAPVPPPPAVEGSSTGEETPGEEGSGETADPFEMPETGKGKPYVYVVPSHRLTYGLIERLSRVIVSCEGGGTQPLILQTESGEVLWNGPEILVSAVQFKVLAEEYDI